MRLLLARLCGQVCGRKDGGVLYTIWNGCGVRTSYRQVHVACKGSRRRAHGQTLTNSCHLRQNTPLAGLSCRTDFLSRNDTPTHRGDIYKQASVFFNGLMSGRPSQNASKYMSYRAVGTVFGTRHGQNCQFLETGIQSWFSFFRSIRDRSNFGGYGYN